MYWIGWFEPRSVPMPQSISLALESESEQFSSTSSASVIVVGLVQFAIMRDLFQVGDNRSKGGVYEC